MFGKEPALTPLELRKRLLIAESEINRVQLQQEWETLAARLGGLADRAKTISTYASVTAALVRYRILNSDTKRNAAARIRSARITRGSTRATTARRTHAAAALLDIDRENTPNRRSVYRSSARPTGHRSASYESSNVGSAAPAATSASFHPRFHASWIPVFMP